MKVARFLLGNFLLCGIIELNFAGAEGIAEKILEAKKRMGELEVQQTKMALQLAQEGQNLRQIENNAMLDTQNFITSEKDKAAQLKNAIEKINVLEKQQTDLQKQIQELTKIVSETKVQQRKLQKQELYVSDEMPAEKAPLVENDSQNSLISEDANLEGGQTKTDKLEKSPEKDATDEEKADKAVSEQIADAETSSSENTIKSSSNVSESRTPSMKNSSSEKVETDDANHSTDNQEDNDVRTSDEMTEESHNTIADAEKVINDAEEPIQSEEEETSDSDVSEKPSEGSEEN